MIDRTCKKCDAAFKAHPYQLRAGHALYCSRECAFGPTPPERFCPKCGERIPPKNRRFCSRRCAGTTPRDGRVDQEGYVRIRGNRREHRVVAEAALGRRLLPGEIVHHVNGVRTDNRPENLRVCTTQEEHMRHHRPRNGAAHHCAKLTQAQADEIRARIAAGQPYGEIAPEFRVSFATLTRIRQGAYAQEETQNMEMLA